MARSKLRISPAIERELEGVREAAEHAASHPSDNGIGEFTIRGYTRSEGNWYVDILRPDNPEPLVLDGSKLVEIHNAATTHVED